MNPQKFDAQFDKLQAMLKSQTFSPSMAQTKPVAVADNSEDIKALQDRIDSLENQNDVLNNTIESLKREFKANTEDFQNQIDDLKYALKGGR